MHLLWWWALLLNFPLGGISSLNLPHVEIIRSGQGCDYCKSYPSFEWTIISRLTVQELCGDGFCDSLQGSPWSLVPGTPLYSPWFLVPGIPPHSPWSLDLRTPPHSPADQKALLALGIPLVPENSGVLYWSKGGIRVITFFFDFFNFSFKAFFTDSPT